MANSVDTSSKPNRNLLPAALALVAIAAIFFIVSMGSGGTVKITPTGELTVDIQKDEAFASVLQKSLDADRETVEAILESKGYFSLHSPGLLTALSGLKVENEADVGVVAGFRRMLGDLEGPFSRPGTLTEADERLVKALEELDIAEGDATEASALLTELWLRNLDQEGIFKQRYFVAEISQLTRTPEDWPVVYTCAGGALVSGRTIHLFTEHGNELIEVAQNPAVFTCPTPAVSARQLLTGKHAVRIGVSRTLYSRLFNPDGSRAMTANPSQARFVVYPRNLVGLMKGGGI